MIKYKKIHKISKERFSVATYFTCVSYDTVTFLIQSRYVVSGAYMPLRKDSENIVFNRETLPHIHIGSILEKEFECHAQEQFDAALIMRMEDFEPETRRKITEFTQTAFPASGHFALSMSGSIESKQIDEKTLRLPPKGIRKHFAGCGISALSFATDGKKLVLLAPDTLLRKFFSARLVPGRGENPEQ